MGLLGVLLVLFTSAIVAWNEYDRRLAEARRETEVEAHFLADHANRLFELSRIAFDGVNHDIAGLDWNTIETSATLHQQLRGLADTLLHIDDIWLNDETGRLRATSFAFPTPASDASDRANFLAARMPGDALFVGPPIMGRITHAPTFLISRRLEWPDHRFRGMVSATADISYFVDYWQQLSLHYDARVTLFQAGDPIVILLQFPEATRLDLKYTISPGSNTQGSFDRFGARSRFGSYDKVPDVPLYAAVDISSRTILAQWLAWLGRSLPFPAAGVLGFGFLTHLALRQARREAEATAILSATNRKLREEIQTREQAEEQVRQMQKMEAIGQLTGGIAHDFNNMLAVIVGNLGLLRKRLERGEKNLDRIIDGAEEGAQRAATLTRRLLAFARRQALMPQTIDIGKFVDGLYELLRRALSEAVEIEAVLAPGLWPVRIDPGQLENAVLNLAINARDAMPDGGKLTITTTNAVCPEGGRIPAGEYVEIAVGDTGTGMSPDIAAKAFEPFFTTKTAGSGTGLGLSQVYGFVRQSGGYVTIDSEVGQGTTVRMYFRRSLEAPSTPGAETRSALLPTGRQNETILVVEDQETVLRMSVEALRHLGYTVFHADGAEAAMRILLANRDIALLFTDVVMPQTNGRQLAEEAQRHQPRLKVLFTTGFSPDVIVHDGLLDAGIHLLAKPFTIEQLARRVRDVLDKA
jgi:signal transduction histidine kinase/CheY-like chemotaxis protein